MREVDGHAFSASQLPAGRVAVMFTADWCGYCQRFLPQFRRASPAWLVDLSEEDEPAWDDHHIAVVPTVIVFQDGAEVRRWSGVLKEAHAAEIVGALSQS